jgi:hypothetical protein
VGTKLVAKKPLFTTALGAVGVMLGVVVMGVSPAVLGLVPSAAAASPTTAKLDLTLTASYTCPYSCASPSDTLFSVQGVAYAGVTTFREFLIGRVLNTSKGCSVQSEQWSLTEQSGPDKGDALWLTSTSDKICPTAYPNVLIETSSFKVTGGTGAFKGATGKGTSWWSVLAYPQVGDGELLASITY